MRHETLLSRRRRYSRTFTKRCWRQWAQCALRQRLPGGLPLKDRRGACVMTSLLHFAFFRSVSAGARNRSKKIFPPISCGTRIPSLALRGCPCPVAGRSLRHPASAHSMLTALRHPACADQSAADRCPSNAGSGARATPCPVLLLRRERPAAPAGLEAEQPPPEGYPLDGEKHRDAQRMCEHACETLAEPPGLEDTR